MGGKTSKGLCSANSDDDYATPSKQNSGLGSGLFEREYMREQSELKASNHEAQRTEDEDLFTSSSQLASGNVMASGLQRAPSHNAGMGSNGREKSFTMTKKVVSFRGLPDKGEQGVRDQATVRKGIVALQAIVRGAQSRKIQRQSMDTKLALEENRRSIRSIHNRRASRITATRLQSRLLNNNVKPYITREQLPPYTAFPRGMPSREASWRSTVSDYSVASVRSSGAYSSPDEQAIPELSKEKSVVSTSSSTSTNVGVASKTSSLSPTPLWGKGVVVDSSGDSNLEAFLHVMEGAGLRVKKHCRNRKKGTVPRVLRLSRGNAQDPPCLYWDSKSFRNKDTNSVAVDAIKVVWLEELTVWVSAAGGTTLGFETNDKVDSEYLATSLCALVRNPSCYRKFPAGRSSEGQT